MKVDNQSNMVEGPVRVAGVALIWRLFQMGGVKAIFMVRLLVLAYLLTPEDFGLIAIATTATGLLTNLTNLGIIPAVVQAESIDDIKYDSAWTFEITRSLLVTVLTVLLAPMIATVFTEPNVIPIIRVIALRPLIGSMTSIKVATLNRNLAFRPLALIKIVEAISNTVISIALAKSLGVWAIVYGMLGGAIVMVITSYILAPYRPRILFNLRAIEPLIKFGGWLFLSGLVAMAGNFGLRMMITRQLGTASLGLYFLAVQLAFLPNEVANEAVGAVAFPLFARLQNEVRKATRVFQALYSGLAAILFPVCGLIFVLAPALPKDILGTNWYGTESLIRILAFVVLIGIFGDLVVQVFKGFGRPEYITILEVAQSTMILIFIWVLTDQFGLTGAALAWLPAVLFSQFLCAIFVNKILDHPLMGLVKPSGVIIMTTCLSSSMAMIILNQLPGLLGLVSASLFCLSSAVILLWLFDRRFHLGFANYIVMIFPQLSVFIHTSAVNHEHIK